MTLAELLLSHGWRPTLEPIVRKQGKLEYPSLTRWRHRNAPDPLISSQAYQLQMIWMGMPMTYRMTELREVEEVEEEYEYAEMDA